MAVEKIAILSANIPPYYSGAGKRALNQAKYLVHKGYKIVFITTTPYPEKIPGMDIVVIPIPKYYETISLAGTLSRQFYHPILFAKLLQILVKKKIKLLHCIPAFSWLSYNAVLAAKLTGINVIIESTLEGSDDPLAIKRSRIGSLKFVIFKMADAIINISPLLVSRCREAGLPEEKLYLIPNSVDINRFCPPAAETKVELKRSLKLDQYDCIFIYAGIMRSRKRVDLLIEVFKIVKKQLNGSLLVLAGPIDKDDENVFYYKQLKKQVESEGLNGAVIFTGNIDNMEQWMKASDIFLFASEREGFGTVMVEAMSTGLPVVAMRIPHITDFIIDKSGIIVDNKKEFAQALIRLAKDDNYRDSLSLLARERVMNNFSNDMIMKQYLDLYNRFIN